MKKIIHFILTLALLMALVSTQVFAATTGAVTTSAAAPTLPASIRVEGTVTKRDDGRLQLTNDGQGAAFALIMLSIGDGTVIIDADGNPASAADIKNGESIVAYIPPVMTMIYPPQTEAILIVRGLTDGAVIPVYAQVTAVKKVGDKTIASTDLNIDLTLSSDTVLFPYKTRNIVVLDQIQPGTKIVAWYAVVLDSFPGQATPSKVMVLSGEATSVHPTPNTPALPASVRVEGTVKKIKTGQYQLTNSAKDAAYKKIILNVTDDTVIIDAKGTVKAIKDIKNGKKIAAYVSPAMAQSEPPQTSALVIVTGLTSKTNVPVYFEVTGVSKVGDRTVVATNGNVNLVLSGDTKLVPYKTRNVVVLDQIQPGTKLIAWYDVVTASFPAQAIPTKVMVL
jgi:hypothetical protein